MTREQVKTKIIAALKAAGLDTEPLLSNSLYVRMNEKEYVIVTVGMVKR